MVDFSGMHLLKYWPVAVALFLLVGFLLRLLPTKKGDE